MLTATWTPLRGVDVLFSDLPDVWLIALDRLARDLHMRQYGARIEHIDGIAMCRQGRPISAHRGPCREELRSVCSCLFAE